MKSDLGETCFFTLILFVLCLFFSFLIYTKSVNIVKVKAEILDTYQESKYDDIEEKIKITNYIVVSYNYENKNYITDVSVITRLGKPKGKKITVYVDKTQPNMAYSRTICIFVIFFVLIMWFAVISKLLEIIAFYNRRLKKIIDKLNLLT